MRGFVHIVNLLALETWQRGQRNSFGGVRGYGDFLWACRFAKYLTPWGFSILLYLNRLMPLTLMGLRHPSLVSDHKLFSSLERHDQASHRPFIVGLNKDMIFPSFKEPRDVHLDRLFPIFRSGDRFAIDAQLKHVVTSDDQWCLGRFLFERQGSFKVCLLIRDIASFPDPNRFSSEGLHR